jgi:hypothetical protein
MSWDTTCVAEAAAEATCPCAGGAGGAAGSGGSGGSGGAPPVCQGDWKELQEAFDINGWSLNPTAFIVRDAEAISVRVYPSVEAHVLLPGGKWGYHSSSKAKDLSSFNFQLVNGPERLQGYAPTQNGQNFMLLTFDNVGESAAPKSITLSLWADLPVASRPPNRGAVATLARRHLVAFGGTQDAAVACNGPRLETFSTEGLPVVPADASPLANRTQARGVAAGDRVFVGFGTALVDQSNGGNCLVSSGDNDPRLWDGAFFDPTTGTWESPVALPDMPDLAGKSSSAEPLRLFWSGTQVVVIERYTGTPRAHLLSPGESSFRTRVIPDPVAVLFFDNDPSDAAGIAKALATATVAPLEDELFVTKGTNVAGHAQLWNPETGATTLICDPPATFMNRGTGGRAKNGDIWVLSEDGSAQLTP